MSYCVLRCAHLYISVCAMSLSLLGPSKQHRCLPSVHRNTGIRVRYSDIQTDTRMQYIPLWTSPVPLTMYGGISRSGENYIQLPQSLSSDTQLLAAYDDPHCYCILFLMLLLVSLEFMMSRPNTMQMEKSQQAAQIDHNIRHADRQTDPSGPKS